jgi:spermidine synthase
LIYVFTFILAACSIIYELLLGQSLVTIGLYMLAMGIGALIAEGRLVRRPVIALLRVETLLTVVGGGSVSFMFLVNALGVGPLFLMIFAHALIVIIGILSGFEIPLLMRLKALEAAGKDNLVLGIDYIGAFFGTLVFAFFFYPMVGLVPTAFAIALLNAVVGIGLLTQVDKIEKPEYREYGGWLGVQAVLLVALALNLYFAERINEYFVASYLGIS